MENIRQLLSSLGNPQNRFPSVHIAGTNGKGSTASMIAAVLTASGYRTGLYTSPHLVNFTERIRINGIQISSQTLAHYTQSLRKVIEKTKATFFEATTAIALHYFAESGIDVAVIETGLGGRLDATNLVKPVVTIITSIGLEHTDILGSKLVGIAREKGGIIKNHIPCLLGKVRKQELEVFRKIAGRQKAPLIYLPEVSSSIIKSVSFGGLRVNIRTPSHTYRDIRCPLVGEFQTNNLTLALTAVDELRSLGYSKVTLKSIQDGLMHIQRLTGLRARVELFSKDPFIILDVAHNPDAVRTLINSLRKLYAEKLVLVFGVMRDKDVGGMVRELVNSTRFTITVAPKTPRALEPETIARMFQTNGGRCVCARTVLQAADLAIKESRPGEVILITGSHYVVGEFLKKNR